MQAARLGASVGVLDGLTANRRERLPDGTTILGVNREGACDRSVSVVRFDDVSGTAIGTLVAFACHLVVFGPDVAESSSDFVGPIRSAVRDWTGAACIFLQGCAGNILPVESFHEAAGPEVEFGRRLALVALNSRAVAETLSRQLERSDYSSAVPIARYRWRWDGTEPDRRVDAAEAPVQLPLEPLPTLDEITRLQYQLETRV